MPHICYIYIHSFQCLHNVDITFDHRFNYSYNSEKGELIISAPTKKLPEDFWGAGIWSVTGIVGNNGAGKTTVNRFLLNAVVDGLVTKDLDGIVVYENNKTLLIYHNNSKSNKTITVKRTTDVPYNVTTIKQKFSHFPSIQTFFYQGHFSAEFSSSDLCSTEYSGLYNATEGYLLRKDFEMFANATDLYYTCPVSTYLVSHISQKHQRICRLLINEELRSNITQFRFPPYIMLSPNHGGQDHLKFHPLVQEETKKALQGLLDPMPIHGIIPTKEECIGMFIYFSLLNAIADNVLPTGGSEILRQWRDNVNPNQEVMPQFQRLISAQQDETVNKKLQTIHDVLNYIFNLANYDEYGGFYIDAFNEKEKVNAILELKIIDTFYLTSRFFDMHYSHNHSNGYNQLSSGEDINMNLYALLHDAIVVRPRKFSLKPPCLILLDEAEIGFHPEWQRTFINTLLDVLHSLNVKPGHDYQVVITSHSPVLLSDIPSCCCNFLKRVDDTTTINLRNVTEETYASNVFVTYRNSFFLENGMIGKHAENRLKALEEKCKNGAPSAKDEIKLIGDQRLQQYFVSLLAKSDKEEAIRYHQEQIRKLQEGGI